MKTWNLRKLMCVLLLLFVFEQFYESHVHGLKYDATLRLLENFTEGNSKNIRPGIDEVGRTVLNITLHLVAISEVNEIKSYISVLGFLNVTWVEPRFSWDPKKYDDVTDITVASNKVWVPSLIIGNPSDSVTFYRDVTTDVKLSYDGRATWMPGALNKPFCAMNVYVYPFDRQTCDMYIVAASVEAEYLELVSTLPHVATSFYTDNSEWELKRTWTKAIYRYENMSFLHFYFELCRKPGFLVVNLVFPVAFLSFLNAMVFVLPADSGERISFAVTIFLSYFVFITLVIQSIPKISDPIPLLCYYIMAMLCASGLIIVTTICNLNLHHKSSKVTPGMKKVAAIFGRDTVDNKNSRGRCDDMAGGGRECSTGAAGGVTWRDVSGVLDNLLLYTFLLLDSLTLAAMLYYMTSYYDT